MNRVNVFAIHRCINEEYGLIRMFTEKIRISPTKLWRVRGRIRFHMLYILIHSVDWSQEHFASINNTANELLKRRRGGAEMKLPHKDMPYFETWRH